MTRLMHWPEPLTLRRLTGAALAATLLFILVFAVHDRPLRPGGIVAYEVAFTPDRAADLFRAWGETGRQAARESLWIDFGFMPAYALLLAGLALTEARLARAAWPRQLAGWAVAMPFGAWLLDVVENTALLAALGTPDAPPAGPLLIAGVAAGVKFILIGLSVVYILAGFWSRRK